MFHVAQLALPGIITNAKKEYYSHHEVAEKVVFTA